MCAQLFRFSSRSVGKGLSAGVLAAGLLVLPPVLGDRAVRASEASASLPAGLTGELQKIVQQHLEARREAEGISGISVHISRSADDAGIDVAAGRTSRTGGEPIDRDTLFQIGSNTKAFTAAVVLKLEAEGRLDIDQTVGDWLPQYPAWKHNTIRQLLNMTSDIPTYSEAPTFMRHQAADKFRHFTPEQLVAYAYPATAPDRLPPSEGWSYSNTNYVLAGMIAAKAGGASYDTLLRRKIIRALGLDDTRYSSWAYPSAIIRRMASGYFENPACSDYTPDCKVGQLKPLDGQEMRWADISWTGAAGGIVSTPEDLARWARALFGGRVLPNRQLEEMKELVSLETGRPIARTTPDDPRGFGLGLAQLYDPEFGSFWMYEGMTLGYRAVLAWFPKPDLVMTIFANSQPPQGQDQIHLLAAALYKAVLPNR
jgi:D-alanyl-D-alanine carboxypeptidase